MTRPNTIADFYANFVRGDPDECWPWLGAITWEGYGAWTLRGERHPAHAWMYRFEVGPMPEGEVVDHLCHTTACTVPYLECPHHRCVNLAHLQATTDGVNVSRGNSPVADHGRKTCCPTCGHPYDAIDSAGARRCRPCRNQRVRERRAHLKRLSREGRL